MKTTLLACALGIPALAVPYATAVAGDDVQAALSDCKNEAVSTGLENEADIQAYVDLCMQSFGGVAGYGDSGYAEPAGEPPMEDAAGGM